MLGSSLLALGGDTGRLHCLANLAKAQFETNGATSVAMR